MRLTPHHGPAARPVPRELPRPIADFTGRGDELATLRRLLDVGSREVGRVRTGATVIISAIDGMGGIGKSALAIQVVHQLVEAGAFADGQLYVNLQGATPGLAPLEPLDALGRMLRALGLDPAQIPTETEEAAARFRSLAAERHLLLLLDNATSAEQVRPLLPASPTCRVLVTSRHALATLEGACALHLDILPMTRRWSCLPAWRARSASPMIRTARPKWCGIAALPLAIRIAGARLAVRPGWALRVLATRLAHTAHRLEELRVREVSVRASFGVSFQAPRGGRGRSRSLCR